MLILYIFLIVIGLIFFKQINNYGKNLYFLFTSILSCFIFIDAMTNPSIVATMLYLFSTGLGFLWNLELWHYTTIDMKYRTWTKQQEFFMFLPAIVLGILNIILRSL